MTYVEAALSILRSAARPLTSREITDRALKAGLIKTAGKTPEATMSAALYMHMTRAHQLRKVSEPGPTRAKRDSVRWTVEEN